MKFLHLPKWCLLKDPFFPFFRMKWHRTFGSVMMPAELLFSSGVWQHMFRVWFDLMAYGNSWPVTWSNKIIQKRALTPAPSKQWSLSLNDPPPSAHEKKLNLDPKYPPRVPRAIKHNFDRMFGAFDKSRLRAQPANRKISPETSNLGYFLQINRLCYCQCFFFISEFGSKKTKKNISLCRNIN